MRKRFGGYSKAQASKLIQKLLELIKDSVVFVEGKKDKLALVQLGCNVSNILTISGNLRQSCESLGNGIKKVIILTDLDRRGNELAKRAVEELERYSIGSDIETRKEVGEILNVKYFEDIERKYMQFLEEIYD